jgi:hypothetical protein
MNDLTDLQICKRIAEIELLSTIVVGDKLVNVKFGSLTMNGADYSDLNDAARATYNAYNIYNPLTDDALCFKFAVDDKMMLSWVECPAGSGKAYFVNVGDKSTDYCDTPNRAVCMAKLKVFSNG